MRILVTEDEKATRDALKAALKSDGFAVDTAEDGERGSYITHDPELSMEKEARLQHMFNELLKTKYLLAHPTSKD